jgi:hypothetical protein
VGYHNLTLSGGNNARTMTGVTNIAGTLSYLHTAGTVTLDVGTTVGSLIVNGNGGTLATANAAPALTVTGTTTISAGTLRLGGSAATATFTGDFTIGGGTFDGNGGVPTFGGNFTANGGALPASSGAYAFTGSGKTIGGTVNPIPIKFATINGSYTLGQNVSCASGGIWTVSGGTLSFGARQLTGAGTLTVNSGGTVVGNGTNQLTSGLAALNFNGTLNINQGLPTFSGGESFQVFGAGAYNITSMAIIPATPPGAAAWDYTTTPGTLIVVGGSGGGDLIITSITRSGPNITLMGTGGTAGGAFNVLNSPDVSAARATWPAIASGNFDGSGNFNITFAAPGTPSSFFVIQK